MAQTPMMAKRQRRRQIRSSLCIDPEESAKAAGLRYVSDERPGIRRRRTGRGFTYLGVDGRPMRNLEAVSYTHLTLPTILRV